MTVAVVIPAYNAGSTLGPCLEACHAQTRKADTIIVVDDGSTDETANIAESYDVIYIRLDRAGPAAARNRGVRESDCDIVIFTDADCVPEREWIEKLLAGFETGVAGVGGSYANANTRFLLSRLVHEEIMMRHQQMQRDADFLGSYNVAYRREAFLEAGGFDENFRHASGEDNDLAYRIHDAGYRLVFLPGARVAHFHPARLGPYLRTQARHGFWRMKLYAKHVKRASGDQYAGLIDLLAPPTVLACAALAVLTLLCYVVAPASAALAAFITASCALAYFLMRVVAPVRMLLRTGKAEMWWFLPLAIFRDIARGAGLLWGLWWFQIRKKKTI